MSHAVLQLRVELVESAPAIWRRLRLPSDLTLDVFHRVLQAVFGWTNSHAHKFSVPNDIGGVAKSILSEMEVAEGEVGWPESDLRLDQVLSTEGDVLIYVYDFGDYWKHTITLEAIEMVETIITSDRGVASTALVRCIDGERYAPLDDVGGIHGWQELVDLATGRTAFDSQRQREAIADLGLWDFVDVADLDAINRALERVVGAQAALERLQLSSTRDANGPLVRLVGGFVEELGREAQLYLAGYVAAARLEDPVEISEVEAAAATAVYRILLDQVGDGIPLTNAGYIPPAQVRALMEELDLDPFSGIFGQGARESHIPPLRTLRQSASRMRLVRVSKGQLHLTKRGLHLRNAPVELFNHIAGELPLERSEFGSDAGLLLLLLVAAGEADGDRAVLQSLDLLTAMLGWELSGRGRYGNEDALFAASDTRSVLEWASTGTLSGPTKSSRGVLGGDHAKQLARAALHMRV
jgi:Plasmid pRiA4b ORF-3-like protein